MYSPCILLCREVTTVCSWAQPCQVFKISIRTNLCVCMFFPICIYVHIQLCSLHFTDMSSTLLHLVFSPFTILSWRPLHQSYLVLFCVQAYTYISIKLISHQCHLDHYQFLKILPLVLCEHIPQAGLYSCIFKWNCGWHKFWYLIATSNCQIPLPPMVFGVPVCLQWPSLAPEGTFVNAWRHFRLSQPEREWLASGG